MKQKTSIDLNTMGQIDFKSKLEASESQKAINSHKTGARVNETTEKKYSQPIRVDKDDVTMAESSISRMGPVIPVNPVGSLDAVTGQSSA